MGGVLWGGGGGGGGRGGVGGGGFVFCEGWDTKETLAKT